MPTERPPTDDALSNFEREKLEQYEREALHFAAQERDVAKVRELIELGHPVSAFDDDVRFTPLHYAAANGDLETIAVLIEAGADVHARDESTAGNTPLREVAGNCSVEVASALLRAGADPRIPGWMQLTALDVAKRRKRPEGREVCRLMEHAAEPRTGGITRACS